jgi:hypothetical protein
MRRKPLSRLKTAVRRRPLLRVPARALDVESATLRYLMYGLLPAWFVPALLDWRQHRRTDIEHTSGTRESLIHALMMAEVGLPVAVALTCEINPAVLVLIAGALAAHEATALWDVTTAVESGRDVRPWEQHIHSFLEAMPFMATSALLCLHWEQVHALLLRSRDPRSWRLRWKARRLPASYLASVGVGIAGAIVLPYGEELLRCARASR